MCDSMEMSCSIIKKNEDNYNDEDYEFVEKSNG